MACNSCKDKNKLEQLSVYKKAGVLNESTQKKTIGFTVFEYSVRILLFSIMVLFSPLILLFVWYLLFKTVILNNGQINMMPFLLATATSLGIGRPPKDYDSDDDYEDLDINNPDDYELVEPIDEIKL